MRLIDLTGQRFGRLVVTGRGEQIGNRRKWRCQCDCGCECQVLGANLKSRRQKSCGCLQSEWGKRLAAMPKKHQVQHGYHGTPTYISWASMIQRVLNVNHKAYKNYGARGITICERWRVSFNNFLADMGDRPMGTTLERIDNDGNYEPSNCRWATPAEQAANRRPRGAVLA